MSFSIVYIGWRFLYRIGDFLRHWYVRSARMYSNYVINRFERLDRRFAWMVTLKNLFQPLYRDYTIIGYIIGFIFRSIRLLLASIIYIFLFCLALFLYMVWLLIPIVLILSSIHW